MSHEPLPHPPQEPLQPATFSVLQRGQRISSEGMPHDGQFFRIPIYATPTIRAMIPPRRNAKPIDVTIRPIM